MKIYLIITALLMVGCGTIPRPDLGTKEVADDVYRAEQGTCLGKPVGKPQWVRMPSKSDNVTKALQKPAILTLSISLPLGLLLGAIMVVGVSNPVIMSRIGWAAAVCLTVSIGAGIWLWLSIWFILVVPIVLVGLCLAHKMSAGKRLKFGGVE